jgi:phospholipase/carboxylesterase
MIGVTAPLITRWGSRDPQAPLIVLFQAAHETDLVTFARHLPAEPLTPVHLPAEGPFDPGRDLAWFRGCFAEQSAAQVPVVLVGFGAAAAFAGGLLLADPARFAAAALLHGTLPFEAGLPITRGRLAGVPIFLTHRMHDTELQRGAGIT